MRIKFILPLVVLLGMIPILVACGNGEKAVPVVVEKIVEVVKPVEVFNLKFQAAWPTTSTMYIGFENFAKRVDEMSAGRVKIETLPSGSIVPAFEIQDAVSEGVIDGGHTTKGYITGKSRAAIPLSHGPLFGMDYPDFFGWYYEGGGKELSAEWYRDELNLNLVSILINPAGPQALGWFNREINSLEDIQGLKYRIYGIGNQVYGKLGVAVVTIPGGEILPALERGVIDAAEWVGGLEDLNLGINDVLNIHYTPGMHEPVTNGELVINKDTWNALGPDLQAIIEAAATENYWRWWVQKAEFDAIAYRRMVNELGVEVRKTPDSILYEFLRVYETIVEEDSAADPFYKKVIDSQRAYAGLVVPYKLSVWANYDFRGKFYWEDQMFLLE